MFEVDFEFDTNSRPISEGTTLLVRGVESGGTTTQALVTDLGGPDDHVGVSFADSSEEDGNGFAWVHYDDIIEVVEFAATVY